MATNNSVNSPLSGTTGTGNFVGSTSPTLTNPNMNAIYANNDLEIAFGTAASAVNYLTITNSPTGNPVSLIPNGSDTNVPLYLAAKGSSQLRIGSNLLMYNTSGGNNYTIFTTTASGAKTVTIPDLTGTMAISGSSQNVSFNQVQTSQINDPSQNLPVAKFSNPASAVNYLSFFGQSTGFPPEVQVAGSDTNIGLNLRCKGTGGVQLISAATTTPLAIYNGTSSQHSTSFAFSNTAASRTVTFPDATGTVALSGASQDVTFNSVSWSDTTKGIVGTTTNNDASAGYVGQVSASFVSQTSPVTLTASTQTNITSLLLDAGDYDVYFQAGFIPASTKVLTLVYTGLNTTSAVVPPTTSQNGFASWFGTFTGDGSSKLVLNGFRRYSLASTTTIYLVGLTASSGNTDGFGGIVARRRR